MLSDYFRLYLHIGHRKPALPKRSATHPDLTCALICTPESRSSGFNSVAAGVRRRHLLSKFAKRRRACADASLQILLLECRIQVDINLAQWGERDKFVLFPGANNQNVSGTRVELLSLNGPA